ncbi:MAG: UDP-N-acetylmuramoyl-tripeptide--D-alanyl-D-alanine ligase, partial [Bacteroidales bacterium]|nr:UDP-N-acetylmuramoyl-tripeptide--D-alanyl-D-alanine ligase [Bacteroidales bacterium]
MIEYNINQINKIINGKVIGNKNISIKNISIDSRTIYSAKDSVFFALQGKNNDGHKYISSLIESGVKVFVVNRIENKWLKNNRVSFIQVQDTLKALQEFAAFHRKQFSYPVISITGSNGKTIIKEWLYQVLYYDYQIVRSPKSYNSQVGVPLSVLLMDKNYNLAIFEAGISQTGEMEKLEKILKPTIGVFTNIGEAHQENFKSIKQKTEEKIKLFQSSEKIIYCKNYKLIHECICNTYPQKIKISWSFKNDSDLYINEIIKENEKTRITGIYKKEKIKIEIPFTDNASLENAIHVWLLLLEMNYNHQIIAERMNSLHPIGMRMELKEGINNCSIINDAYNSDLNSLTIALDFLNQQNKNSKKTLILSDIMQSGKKENELYQTVSDLLIKKIINKFIGIGPSLKKNSSLFSKKSTFFESTGEFLNNYSKNNFNNEDILIKGSRDFKFENISAFLEYKGHRTILEINLNA